MESYGRIIDHMAVIFPFELPYYEAYDVPATYVGHSLAGKVKPTLSREAARIEYGLPSPGDGPPSARIPRCPVIGLLPGSRANEIRRLMPVIVEAAQRLAGEFASARFLLFQAASVPDEVIAGGLARFRATFAS